MMYLPSAHIRSEGTVVGSVCVSVCLLLNISLLEPLFVLQTIALTKRGMKVR